METMATGETMELTGVSIYRGQQITLVVVSSLMTFFGVLALSLRVAGRYLVVRHLGIDDWLMVGGTFFTVGYLIEILYGLRFGEGLHGINLSIDNMSNILKIIYAIQLTYNTVLTLVKCSIVSFYLRLATVDSTFRRLCKATIQFIAVLYVISQLVAIMQCLPIKANWDLTENIPKQCINTLVYYYTNAAINIIVDIWILVLPIKTLSGIKRPTRDKIVLLVIFGVGAFSCLSSIIRLYTVRIYAQSSDPFYDGVPINTWSMIEVNVAIVCASVPAMKPLFTKTIRERMTTRTGWTTNLATGRTHLGTQFGRQMIPLSDEMHESQTSIPSPVRENKSGYSARATADGFSGSDEYIVKQSSLGGGIVYESAFTVEEHYVGISKILRDGEF